MKPAPTADIAPAFASPKTGAARVTEKTKGEAGAKFRAAESQVDRNARLSQDVAVKSAGKVDVSGEVPRSKEGIGEETDSSKVVTESQITSTDRASPQAPVLSADLAAVLQGMPVPGAVDASAQHPAHDDPRGEASIALTSDASSLDAGEDMTRLAEQLAARASFGRTQAQAPEAKASASPAPEVDVTKAASAVAVSTLQAKTGFDAPIKVTSSQQRWFQAVAPVLTGVASPTTRTDAKLQAAMLDKTTSDETSVALAAPSLENAVEPAHPTANQSSTGNSGQNDHTARDDAKRGVKAEAAIEKSDAKASVRGAVTDEIDATVTPPYQQIRSAVAEAIVGANSAQRTDYVSLHAERPTSSNLTLKTLEISLEPPDLGRVNVKMNLASRDLKLEIEASKASTAQLIANDQAALKRELLSDNADLSSVLVSVTNAVTDAGPASGTTSGDQQFSSNSRTANENTFGSTTSGGRDERKPRQHLDSPDSGASNQQRDAGSDRDARSSGKALYI